MTLSSTTYLKDIDKYIYYQYSMKNFNITIKKILETKPFIINEDGKRLKILDNNYYVMEIFPMTKNYICRIHLDDKKKVIEKYFIMSLENMLLNNIPAFNNLKMAYVCLDFQKKIYNQEYFIDLYQKKEISENDYQKINNEFTKLIKEIDENKNEIYNLNYQKIIDDIEGVI